MELVWAAHAADVSGWARPVASTVRRPLVQNLSTAVFCSAGVCGCSDCLLPREDFCLEKEVLLVKCKCMIRKM